jgi:hypothetical protein
MIGYLAFQAPQQQAPVQPMIIVLFSFMGILLLARVLHLNPEFQARKILASFDSPERDGILRMGRAISQGQKGTLIVMENQEGKQSALVIMGKRDGRSVICYGGSIFKHVRISNMMRVVEVIHPGDPDWRDRFIRSL